MPELSETLRTLRHDLANPLSAILAETQLLLLSEERYGADTLAALRQIEALARRMRQMLQDVDA
jgi:signal transduction histidine kinase